MRQVFIYWDNSNIFYGAQEISKDRNGELDAYHRLRIDFRKLFELAAAGREVNTALAAGSIPPPMSVFWNVLEGQDIVVDTFERGSDTPSEQEVPDERLQLAMYRDSIKHRERPGIVVLLTGDGKGYDKGKGYFRTIEEIHSLGWHIELLSWNHTCHQRMKNWVQENGIFVSLDDYYKSITFLEFLPGDPYMPDLRHHSEPLDLSERNTCHPKP